MQLGKTAEDIKSCPFCGGVASVEEISNGKSVRFSVGCSDNGGTTECLGWQSLTTFPR
jgi:hypothetical protein